MNVTALEEKLAHALKTVDELNAVVTDQATRIDALERKVSALVEFARAAGEGDGTVTLGDQPPPHY